MSTTVVDGDGPKSLPRDRCRRAFDLTACVFTCALTRRRIRARARAFPITRAIRMTPVGKEYARKLQMSRPVLRTRTNKLECRRCVVDYGRIAWLSRLRRPFVPRHGAGSTKNVTRTKASGWKEGSEEETEEEVRPRGWGRGGRGGRSQAGKKCEKVVTVVKRRKIERERPGRAGYKEHVVFANLLKISLTCGSRGY